MCCRSWARGRWASLRQQDEVLAALKTQPPGGRMVLYRQMETLPVGADGEEVLAALEAGLADADPMARGQALASRGVFLPRLLRHLELGPGQPAPEPDAAFPARAAAFVAPVAEGLARGLDARDGRRLRALVALGSYGGEEALRRLEEESRKPELGLLVAEALARQGGPEAARVLTDMILKIPSAFRAAQVAQLRFVPSPQGIELVKRAIRKGDATMLMAGSIALEGLRGPEVASLASECAQRATDGWAALQALESLRRLGRPEHGPLVVQIVETAELPLVKAVGLRVLGYLASPSVVEYLLTGFRTLAEPLRPFALESLVLAGAPEQDVRPLLDGLVSSPKLALALPAVKAMLAFDPDLAVGLVSQILARPEPVARFIGAQCLAFVHTEASREQLAVMAREDAVVPVRMQALVSLAELASVPGAAEAAAEALADPVKEVRRAAARVLSRLPSGQTIAPELIRLLEEGFAAEPDAASLWSWARALSVHAPVDLLADRVKAAAKHDPLRAAFLLRVVEPAAAPVAKLLAGLAQSADAPALRAEANLALACAGEDAGAAELGRMIATGTEREAIEACAAGERLGMKLPAAQGLPRMAGLVKRVAGGPAPQEAPVDDDTTSRMKVAGGALQSLEVVLAQRAKQPPRPSAPGPRPTLSIQAVALPQAGGDVAELSVYSSQGMEARRLPPAPPSGLATQLVAVRDQLGWLGIAWVLGLLLLFGHIGMQIAGMGGLPALSPFSGPTKGPVRVERRSGSVQLERTSGTQELKGGMELGGDGEAVTTGSGSRALLRIQGGDSHIAMGEGARVRLTKLDGALQLREMTGSMRMELRGAELPLHMVIGSTVVMLTEGRVMLVNDTLYVGRGKATVRAGSQTIVVPAGEQVAFDASGAPGTPMAFKAADFDWEPR